MENVGAVTDEKREKNLAYKREWARKTLAAETVEQREKRLEKKREYRARETPEQREKRREKKREYAREQYARETPEQREKRLEKKRARWRAQARKRRSRETREQREKRREYAREYAREQARNSIPDRRRMFFDGHLKHKYGVTREEYDEITLAACGRCDACGKQDTNAGHGLCLDHDHATGAVRGMLCLRCNTALGNLNDSPLLIAKLAAYASGIGRSA